MGIFYIGKHVLDKANIWLVICPPNLSYLVSSIRPCDQLYCPNTMNPRYSKESSSLVKKCKIGSTRANNGEETVF